MPVELELEENVAQEEQDQLAKEGRDRNSLAIEEVVGRNPARKPTIPELSRSTAKDRN
jgi:hypothetical protein